MIRKHITPGTELAVRLSSHERDLVVDRAFLDPEIDAKLRHAVPTGSRLIVKLNLDDIDDLLGCVAAEANHCDDGKVRRALGAFAGRLSDLLDRYTDEPATEPAKAERPKPRFTATQGQYLAFIHYYTKVHRVPPAEADLQRYFRVSPPTVHAMIVTLERQRFIERTPGKARSVRLLIPAGEVPDLS